MSRRFFLAGVLLILALGNPGVSYPDSLWGDNGFVSFCKSLRVPEKEMLRSSLGDYVSAIEHREKVDLNKILIADFKHIAPVLMRAIKLRWAALDFFTMREFAGSSACLVMLDKKSLAEVDRAFDLHGLWMTRTTIPSKDNEDLTMDFILLGHGKLIIGYGKEAWVRVPDYKIQARYTRYTSMAIEHRETLKGLTEIKTLARPDAEFESFQARAPLFFGIEMPIQIRALTVDGDGIVVSYRALAGEREERRPKIPMSERYGPGCEK